MLLFLHAGRLWNTFWRDTARNNVFRQSALCDIGDECPLPYVCGLVYCQGSRTLHYDIKDKVTK